MAKANDVDLEIVEVDTASPSADYLKINKLGKVPTFEGEDGYVLYECMAIAIYSGFLPFLLARVLPHNFYCNVMSFAFQKALLLSLTEQSC